MAELEKLHTFRKFSLMCTLTLFPSLLCIRHSRQVALKQRLSAFLIPPPCHTYSKETIFTWSGVPFPEGCQQTIEMAPFYPPKIFLILPDRFVVFEPRFSSLYFSKNQKQDAVFFFIPPLSPLRPREDAVFFLASDLTHRCITVLGLL